MNIIPPIFPSMLEEFLEINNVGKKKNPIWLNKILVFGLVHFLLIVPVRSPSSMISGYDPLDSTKNGEIYFKILQILDRNLVLKSFIFI